MSRHFPGSWGQCSQTYSQNRLLCAEPTCHTQVANSHILQCSISLKNLGFWCQAPPTITVPAVQQDAFPTADLTPSLLAPQRKPLFPLNFPCCYFTYFWEGRHTRMSSHGMGCWRIILIPHLKQGDGWSYHRFVLNIPKHCSSSFFLFLFFLIMFPATYYLLQCTILCN